MDISERWRALPPGGPRDPFALPGDPAFALLHGEGEWTLFAEDPLLVMEGFDPPPLRMAREGELPPLLPDFLGFATYESGCALEAALPPPRRFPWVFPSVHFALHRRVVLLHRPSGRAFEGIREGLPSLGWGHVLQTNPFVARKRGDSDSPEAFKAKVDSVRGEIRRGNVYQANLCRQEFWDYEGDLRELARRLARANPAPFSALVAGPGFAVLSTSPERFLSLGGGRIESRPIKGTAPRSLDPEQDLALAARLLGSAKDRAELAMIVDLVRNDLSRICERPSVAVEEFPRLESFANVHHLVGVVSGRHRPGLGLRDLFAALFPAGSITGCPKLAAITLLQGLEEHPRLAYTGALGWFRHDLAQADFSVAIRTLSAVPGELRLGLGGGIVWDSDPEAEYLETIHKGRTLVRCLSS